jgi:aspartyl protease family protein
MQWGALALGIAAFVYFFDDLRTLVRPDNALPTLAESMRDRPAEAEEERAGFDRTVKLRSDANGHFVFKAAVNERLASFVADTGATYVVITYEDAQRLGLSPQSLDFSVPVQTANGVTRVAPVTWIACGWRTSRSATFRPRLRERVSWPPIFSV